jgi:hypothetical protein
MAVFRSVVVDPSTAQKATHRVIEEGDLYPRVAGEIASYPQGMPEAVQMDGVVFYPEVKDMEMTDTFATNRELSSSSLFILFH